MKDVVIVSGVRTAQGKFSGALKDFSAPQLGSIAIKGAVEKAGITAKDVDEVIMGCVFPRASVKMSPGKQRSEREYPMRQEPCMWIRSVDPH